MPAVVLKRLGLYLNVIIWILKKNVGATRRKKILRGTTLFVTRNCAKNILKKSGLDKDRWKKGEGYFTVTHFARFLGMSGL